jgi:hypothetical protein
MFLSYHSPARADRTDLEAFEMAFQRTILRSLPKTALLLGGFAIHQTAGEKTIVTSAEKRVVH